MRILAAVFCVVLAGCRPSPGPDGGRPDSGAGVDGGDAGRVDSGVFDAGVVDSGPTCTPELCDGLDNDCDGTVDKAADGGALTQLCPLQLGTCQGARVQCTAGKFPPCLAEYGAKYEELESLCDGVDNDCSGVADVSAWRPIGDGTPASLTAVSVPGGWYVATNLDGQMFDEQLRPTSEVFPVGRPGASSRAAGAFAGSLHHLFSSPAGSYLRLLNLDGTYALSADGGANELELPDAGSAGSGSLQPSNDRSTLLVGLGAGLVSLWADGGVRGAFTKFADAGAVVFCAARADEVVLGIPRSTFLELQTASAELQLSSAPVGLASSAPADCAISTHTSAADAGLDAVVAVCPEGARMTGAENLFAGGTMLAPFWEADAGTISHVRLLPSYARATAFWAHQQGGRTTLWIGPVRGTPPTPIAEIASAPKHLGVVASIRGGYLVHAIFDGGQGVKPYGAYVCPP